VEGRAAHSGAGTVAFGIEERSPKPGITILESMFDDTPARGIWTEQAPDSALGAIEGVCH
jgi:hypothetical protein